MARSITAPHHRLPGLRSSRPFRLSGPRDGLPSWTYRFTYDSQGQLDARVVPEMPAEVQWRYVFDDKERLTQLEVVGPDTNLESTSFEYDALGNRTKISFQRGDTLKSYDSECRITQLDGSRGNAALFRSPTSVQTCRRLWSFTGRARFARSPAR
jgi:hypothetical protein